MYVCMYVCMLFVCMHGQGIHTDRQTVASHAVHPRHQSASQWRSKWAGLRAIIPSHHITPHGFGMPSSHTQDPSMCLDRYAPIQGSKGPTHTHRSVVRQSC
mmetsp:Transcript_2708/g.6133  ORF Transcript_2708/g.6133 Transcript_2708/m.6133 type:complete len:101 (-) Transcript_2708:771-1073(-)